MRRRIRIECKVSNLMLFAVVDRPVTSHGNIVSTKIDGRVTFLGDVIDLDDAGDFAKYEIAIRERCVRNRQVARIV